MAAEQPPDIWAGIATQYVGAWGQAAPMVQIAAIIAVVIVVAILNRPGIAGGSNS